MIKRTHCAPLDTRKPAVKVEAPDFSLYQGDPETDTLFKCTGTPEQLKEFKKLINNSPKLTP